MLTHPGRTLRRPPRRTLTALIAVSAALGMSLLTTSAAQAGEVIEKVMDENFQVSESSSGEDTGFDVRSGDRLVITGGGKIKSGLFGQDWVFPDGGNQNDTRAELPLNQSTLYDKTCAGWFGARHRCSPSYSLIGVFGGHPRYFNRKLIRQRLHRRDEQASPEDQRRCPGWWRRSVYRRCPGVPGAARR